MTEPDSDGMTAARRLFHEMCDAIERDKGVDGDEDMIEVLADAIQALTDQCDRAVRAADHLLADALSAQARAGRAEMRLANLIRRLQQWLEYVPVPVRDAPMYRDLQNLVETFERGLHSEADLAKQPEVQR